MERPETSRNDPKQAETTRNDPKRPIIFTKQPETTHENDQRYRNDPKKASSTNLSKFGPKIKNAQFSMKLGTLIK